MIERIEETLKQFLNDDQMAMFQFFMNQNEEETNHEGGFNHGTSGMDEWFTFKKYR